MAQASGQKGNQIHEIVEGLLLRPDSFRPEVVRQLADLHNADTFDDDATRLMEHVIRYGLVERLRKGLRGFDDRRTPTVQAFAPSSGEPLWQRIARDIASGVVDGTRAGRTYGGCTPSMRLGQEAREGIDPELNPQDAFGGKGEGSEVDPKKGNIRCIKCREYVPKVEVIKQDCWECPACLHKVDICTGAVLNEGKPKRSRPVAKQAGTAALEAVKSGGKNERYAGLV